MLILSKVTRFLLVLALGAAGRADTLRAGQSDVGQVAMAEMAFAADGREHGIRESFLRNFAEDGIVFAAGPTNAKEFYNKYQEKGDLLLWRPTLATTARSGELGFTTGPWELKKSKTEDTTLGFGHFVSVWKKQADNSWKVIVDVGIDYPQPTAARRDELQILAPNDKLSVAGGTARREALENAERGFYDALKTDAGTALLQTGDEGLRILRDGTFPTIGLAAAKAILAADHAKVTRINLGGGTSDSSDLGYRYGSYSTDNGEQGYYLTLWHLDRRGNWKILIDLQKRNDAK